MMMNRPLPLVSRIARIGSWSVVALVVATAAGCAEESGSSYAIDRTAVNGLPKVVSTETSWSTAKVGAVDYPDRSIALTGPDGTTHIFRVSTAVANFDQVKQGDTVKMEVLDQVTVNVRRASSPPMIAQSIGVELAALGEKPGIIATRSVEVNAVVASIDYQARIVSLATPGGGTTTIAVSDKMKDFNNVKVGDQVIFTYTEGVAITVSS